MTIGIKCHNQKWIRENERIAQNGYMATTEEWLKRNGQHQIGEDNLLMCSDSEYSSDSFRLTLDS